MAVNQVELLHPVPGVAASPAPGMHAARRGRMFWLPRRTLPAAVSGADGVRGTGRPPRALGRVFGMTPRKRHPRTEPAIAYQRSVSPNRTPCSGASSFAVSRRAPSRLIARCGASDQRAPARHVRSPASASPKPA